MDVIISWPCSADYPNFRSFIKKNRKIFNEVFIVFTLTNRGIDYTNFIKESMINDNITFLNASSISPFIKNHMQDWRNESVNQALDLSKSDWVWFTEQDLIIKNDFEFWSDVLLLMNNSDVIAHREGPDGAADMSRYHPSCLFVKREIIDKTDRYFGITPNVSDHFSHFSNQIDLYTNRISILSKKNFKHMNGLSHNLQLMEDGQVVHYYPDEFKSYLKDCLLLQDVEIDIRYKKIILDRYPELLL